MKLRKIITMGIAAIMAVSAMSVTALAEEVVELDNGAIITIYQEGEYNGPIPRTADMTFSQTITSKLTYLSDVDTGSSILSLSDDETEMVLKFNEALSFDIYMTIYDVTLSSYTLNNNGPYETPRVITISNVPSGHKYKMGITVSSGSKKIQGTVKSY